MVTECLLELLRLFLDSKCLYCMIERGDPTAVCYVESARIIECCKEVHMIVALIVKGSDR